MDIPRILLVDDDRQIARMFRTSLELSGREYEVIDVPSAEEALLELERAPVDLVVSDLKLPGMSGLDLLQRVRARNPQARAIMITAHPSEEVRDRATELGVIAFMTKPIHTNAFLEIVDRVVSIQQQEQKAEAVRLKRRRKVLPHLQELQKTIGASVVILTGSDADILASTGDEDSFHLDNFKTLLTEAGRISIRLSASLGASTPWNVHYFSGSPISLYLVSAGFDLVLVIGVHRESDYGQVGAVARHARTAFSRILSELSGDEVEASSPVKSVNPAADDDSLQEKALERIIKPDLPADADQFWDDASGYRNPSGDDTITYEEARRIGLLRDEIEDEDS